MFFRVVARWTIRSLTALETRGACRAQKGLPAVEVDGENLSHHFGVIADLEMG